MAKRKREKVSQEDLRLINDLNAALQQERHAGSFITVMLFFALVTTFLGWAYVSPLEEVVQGQGKIIPSSREQIVQSLDPGTIAEMLVKEGDTVEKGQVILRLDATRSSAILRESQAKVENLEAMVSRLQAEAYGTPLKFPQGMTKELVERETAAYNSRRKATIEAINGIQANKKVLDKQIAMTAPMVQRGVMSEVELLRMQRESGEMALQIVERENRYTTEASNELVKIEAELAQARENMVMRADPVERSEIRAPMRGVVKNIRINTIGGVVNAGQDILEIVPLDDTLLVEAYIRPNDVAFISPGLSAVVKITAYDYAIYGGLEGEVTLISPDTITDQQQRSADIKVNMQNTYYRILVRTKKNNITDKTGKTLEIIPGMVATVDIKTGEKTVFQYLMKPLTRMKQAMRER